MKLFLKQIKISIRLLPLLKGLFVTSKNFIHKTPKSLFLSTLLYLVTYIGMTHAGLVELYHLKTENGKSIILLGDNHSISNLQEIIDMVDLFKQQEDKNKSITLLIEQALTSETISYFSSSMLISLAQRLEEEHLNKTVIENIEIRTISGTVLNLLDEYKNLHYLSEESFFQNGSSGQKIMVDTVTFQHVYDEYNSLVEMLSDHYKKYDDARIQEFFAQQINIADQHYGGLLYIFDRWKRKYGIQEQENIVSLIKKLKDAELEKKLTQTIKEEHFTLNEKLTVYICRVFIPLFNLNAFDQIIQRKVSSDIVVLVAGYSHAEVMKDCLLSLCGETLVPNDNVITSYSGNNNVITQLAAILNV